MKAEWEEGQGGSLLQEEAQRPDRNQLVGLQPADAGGALPVGAHGLDLSGAAPRSRDWCWCWRRRA